jgi:hypothetical protein
VGAANPPGPVQQSRARIWRNQSNRQNIPARELPAGQTPIFMQLIVLIIEAYRYNYKHVIPPASVGDPRHEPAIAPSDMLKAALTAAQEFAGIATAANTPTAATGRTSPPGAPASIWKRSPRGRRRSDSTLQPSPRITRPARQLGTRRGEARACDRRAAPDGGGAPGHSARPARPRCCSSVSPVVSGGASWPLLR